jgi:hypothetical protein
MRSLLLIVYAELLATGVAAIFVTPLALVQFFRGDWAGLHNYARCATWGGGVLTLAAFGSVIL